MAQTINTNVASLNAQRNLNSPSPRWRLRLSASLPGLRINSARTISRSRHFERMTSQINGLNQATPQCQRWHFAFPDR